MTDKEALELIKDFHKQKLPPIEDDMLDKLEIPRETWDKTNSAAEEAFEIAIRIMEEKIAAEDDLK